MALMDDWAVFMVRMPLYCIVAPDLGPKTVASSDRLLAKCACSADQCRPRQGTHEHARRQPRRLLQVLRHQVGRSAHLPCSGRAGDMGQGKQAIHSWGVRRRMLSAVQQRRAPGPCCPIHYCAQSSTRLAGSYLSCRPFADAPMNASVFPYSYAAAAISVDPENDMVRMGWVCPPPPEQSCWSRAGGSSWHAPSWAQRNR